MACKDRGIKCGNKYTTLLDLARQAKVLSGETACFEGGIQVGIPFSGYPSGVDYATVTSLGIVDSEVTIFNTPKVTVSGITNFDVSNPLSSSYNAEFSGYSYDCTFYSVGPFATTTDEFCGGVTGYSRCNFTGQIGDICNGETGYTPNYNYQWTNPHFSAGTKDLILPITNLSADTQTVGPFWTMTQTGCTGDHIITTQYTGYTITYSFFDVFPYDIPLYGCVYDGDSGSTCSIDPGLGTGYTLLQTGTTIGGGFSGKTNATQENFSAGTLDYRGPLTYLHSLEDALIDNRTVTTKLRVTGGASSGTTGYVLTQVDNIGTAEWVFNSASASTNTFVTSGVLDSSDDLILTYNTAGTVPPIDLSALRFSGNTSGGCITDLFVTNIHGCSPITFHSPLQHIGSSATGLNSIAWGGGNTTSDDFSNILGGQGNSITGNSAGCENNTIVGGSGNTMSDFGTATSDNNIIMGGLFNSMSARTIRSAIIGGDSNIIGMSAGTTANAVIVGGTSNVFPGLTPAANSVILGGIGITALTANTAYVATLNIDTTPIIANTLTDVLVRDGADGIVKRRDIGTIVFSGGSGNCITDLYIINRHGCSGSTITEHDSIQHISSSATGVNSIAWGTGTTASGDFSHAEGSGSTASGLVSHAEGYLTIASGTVAHAEGAETIASGNTSHAEGSYSKAYGGGSHAEGTSTIASGDFSHAEGNVTVSSGIASHAEGSTTKASGDFSHAEGSGSTASGLGSHSEASSSAIGPGSHSEGNRTISSGNFSHSEGTDTIASGNYAHTEGCGVIAAGNCSHAGGESHSLTDSIIASGKTSFVHFEQTAASGIIGAYGDNSTILGGKDHNIGNRSANSTIIGGVSNTIFEDSISSGIFVGSGNTINDDIGSSVIIGGIDNNIEVVSGSSCGCPCDYEYDSVSELCIQISASTSAPAGPIFKATQNDVYTEYGARFCLPHTLGSPTNPEGTCGGAGADPNDYFTTDSIVPLPFWGCGSYAAPIGACDPGGPKNGRLNAVGINNAAMVASSGVWFGFSKCLNLPSDGQYLFALAGDNQIRAYVNEKLVIQNPWDGTSTADKNFKYWWVYAVDLNAGPNTILLEGANQGAGTPASFGCEIVGPFDHNTFTTNTDFHYFTGTTGMNEYTAKTIFSSLEKTGATFDTEVNSCPPDFVFNGCISGCVKTIECSGGASSIIAGGQDNTIYGISPNSGIFGGNSGFIDGSREGAIIGGCTNYLSGTSRSVIIGGQNITGVTDDTAYVPNLNINYQPDKDDILTEVLVRDTDGTVKYRDVASIAGAFSGNTSGGCITDLWVTNIRACSPLFINPGDEGIVEFGSSGDVYIDVVDESVHSNDFHVAHKLIHEGDDNTFIWFTPDRIRIDAGGTEFICIQDNPPGGATGELAINDGGVQMITRVEGVHNESLLFINGLSNVECIGIGTSGRTDTLFHINSVPNPTTGYIYPFSIQGTNGYLEFDDKSSISVPRLRITGSTTGFTSFAATADDSPQGLGINMGVLGINRLGDFRGYGDPGDAVFYASAGINNLNIINQLASDTSKTDDINFYAGSNAGAPAIPLSGETPNLHIHGRTVGDSEKGYIGMNTKSPTERLHVQDGNILAKWDQNAHTFVGIWNLDSGGDARASLHLVSEGENSINSGVIASFGTGYTGSGLFEGKYLPNSLTLATAGGGGNERGNINIGSRRYDGEIRFFAGGSNFIDDTIMGIWNGDGLTLSGNPTSGFVDHDFHLNTDTIQVRDGATTGYILTATDNLGNASWQAPTGSTAGTCIDLLWVSTISGCSPVTIGSSIQSTTSSGTGVNSIAYGFETLSSGDYSHAEGLRTEAGGDYSHAGGYHGTVGKQIFALSIGSFIHQGPGEGAESAGIDNNSVNAVILGGNGHNIYGNSANSGIFAGVENIISACTSSVIVGGGANQIIGDVSTSSANTVIGGSGNDIIGDHILRSVIIGGFSNTIGNGVEDSVIIGGQNITALKDKTVYVPTLNIATIGQDNAIEEVLVRAPNGTVGYRDAATISGCCITPIINVASDSCNGTLTTTANRYSIGDPAYGYGSGRWTAQRDFSPLSTNTILATMMHCAIPIPTDLVEGDEIRVCGIMRNDGLDVAESLVTCIAGFDCDDYLGTVFGYTTHFIASAATVCTQANMLCGELLSYTLTGSEPVNWEVANTFLLLGFGDPYSAGNADTDISWRIDVIKHT